MTVPSGITVHHVETMNICTKPNFVAIHPVLFKTAKQSLRIIVWEPQMSVPSLERVNVVNVENINLISK